MNAPTPEFAARIVEGQSKHLWYKDAIIYQLHVKSFFDSNNDGIENVSFSYETMSSKLEG